jgi:hypothetical protein
MALALCAARALPLSLSLFLSLFFPSCRYTSFTHATCVDKRGRERARGSEGGRERRHSSKLTRYMAERRRESRIRGGAEARPADGEYKSRTRERRLAYIADTKGSADLPVAAPICASANKTPASLSSIHRQWVGRGGGRTGGADVLCRR